MVYVVRVLSLNMVLVFMCIVLEYRKTGICTRNCTNIKPLSSKCKLANGLQMNEPKVDLYCFPTYNLSSSKSINIPQIGSKELLTITIL